MNAEEYWQALCAKTPALAKQAHDKGFEHCRHVTEAIRNNMGAGRNPFDGIFNGK